MPQAKKESYVDRNFVLLFINNLMCGFTFYFLLSSMARYALEEFTNNTSLAGLTASMFILGALVARVLTSVLAERIGRKRYCVYCMTLMLITSALYFIPANLGFLFAVRFFHGLAFGGVNTTAQSIALSALPSTRRGEGTNMFTLSTTAGTSLGPMMGLLVTHNLSFTALFILTAVLTLIGFISVLFVSSGQRKTAEEIATIEAAQPKGFWRFFERSTLKYSIGMIVAGVAWCSVTTFLNNYGLEEGFGDYTAYMFGVYFLGLLVSRPILGKVLDKHGDNIVLIPVYIVFCLSYLLLSIVTAPTCWLLLIGGLTFTFGFGTLLPCLQVVVMRNAPKQNLTQAIATYFFCLDLGSGVGPYFYGLIIPVLGYRLMYLLVALLPLCLLIYYLIIHARKPEARLR